MNLFSIKTRNSIKNEYTKIVFQFTLMIIASLIAGWCFSKLIGENMIHKLTEQMLHSFSASIKDEGGMTSFLLVLLRTSLPDILCITILFVFSFSFVNYIVSDCVLVFVGFRFGINAALLKIATVPVTGLKNALSFYVFKGVFLPVILVFACRMAIYSLELRRFSKADGRLIFSKKSTLSMLILSLTLIGTALILNGLYCLCIYIF